MEVTSKGWSEGKDVIGHVRKFGVSIQRVRIPPGQSEDPQAGSKPCDGGGMPWQPHASSSSAPRMSPCPPVCDSARPQYLKRGP